MEYGTNLTDFLGLGKAVEALVPLVLEFKWLVWIVWITIAADNVKRMFFGE